MIEKPTAGHSNHTQHPHYCPGPRLCAATTTVHPCHARFVVTSELNTAVSHISGFALPLRDQNLRTQNHTEELSTLILTSLTPDTIFLEPTNRDCSADVRERRK